MALNYIWIAFFLLAFVFGLLQTLIFGEINTFSDMVNGSFNAAKAGFEISLYLTGALALWLGLLKIAEKGGLIAVFAKWLSPVLQPLFPSIPKDHPVFGTMIMNFSANMLGLDNAATPIGLKAMEGLQDLNTKKEQASDAQIMFLVLNTSGLTLIPVSVLVLRSEAGAANPADVFIPVLIATFMATLGGILYTGIRQKVNFLNPWLLGFILSVTVLIALLLNTLSGMSQTQIQNITSLGSNILLFGIMVFFIIWGAYKKLNVFETFIEGAKEGFQVAIKIIPYLVAFLVAIAVFKASGCMGFIIEGMRWTAEAIGLNSDFVNSLPTALMKPLSGSGARAMMVDAMATHGPDSFTGRLSSTLQGTTDTTFYILAVYFGSVNIRNSRYAVGAGLIADFVGIISAILLAYVFFG